MKTISFFRALAVGLTAVSFSFFIFPGSSIASNHGSKAAVEKRVHRERKQAENQKMSAYEVELVRKIRSVLADDPALSMEAKNVVITANASTVLLQGSVSSQQEKTRVVETAKNYSGAMSVVDQTVVNE